MNSSNNQYNRTSHLKKYSSYDFPYIVLSADVDIKNLYRFSKNNDISFYCAMIYCVMDAVNDIENFHYRLDEVGGIQYCGELTASFTYLPKGKKDFYVVNSKFENDIISFSKSTKEKAEKQSDERERMIMHTADNPGIIYISALPWIHYTQIIRTIHHMGKDSIPRISWGKYENKEGKMMMPLSVQVHHALMDGIHVGLFYERLQNLIDSL